MVSSCSCLLYKELDVRKYVRNISGHRKGVALGALHTYKRSWMRVGRAGITLETDKEAAVALASCAKSCM
jgi:hypothetical protein